MLKLRRIYIWILALTLLCACANRAAVPSDTPISSAPPENSAAPATEAAVSAPPDPSPTPSAEPVDNTARGALFRAFLNDNYKKLSDAFYGGISGIGFIDLDGDGGIEMLVFDAGASAAMGLQFFDIINNQAVCVSANLETVSSAFGSGYMSAVSVNANRFDDFRLVRDTQTGGEFFIVESGNGAVDFAYSELIRFDCGDEGALTLTSLLYKYEDYNADTGETIGESFRIGNAEASREDYETAYSAFFSGLQDTGFEAQGVMLWNQADYYEAGLDGLLAMADDALALSAGKPAA
ncbi:MAG: hypothetical protein LBL15_06360 [Oscillospiraceae bacterium]|nr:hypothetical protein [Oscillospiraceae bacterium]